MANYMLGPMRDNAALKVGVSHNPLLTLASTILALASSVPIGWLFEAPDPLRRGHSWRHRCGFIRGDTQGTSLTLFLRCFAICLIGYAVSFKLLELIYGNNHDSGIIDESGSDGGGDGDHELSLFVRMDGETLIAYISRFCPNY